MGTVTFDGTRLSDAEALSPGNGAWTDSAGTAAVLEPDYVYQNANSVSEKIKSTELGVGFDATTGVDFTTPKVALFKVLITTVGILSDTASTAGIIEMGSGNRRVNYYRYYVLRKSTYPTTGGWVIVPVDPNVAGYRDATVGSTPSLSALDWFGFVATMTTTTAKAENLAMDAIDYVTSGTGLTITGSSSTFTDFVTYDEGTSANRYGIVTTREGIIYVAGVLTLGSAVSSVSFSDSSKTLVFPNGRFDTGFCGLDINLSQSATAVTISSCTFIGRGRRGFGDFDTTAGVNGTTEIITTNQIHNFETGDAATYSREGGSTDIGPEPGTYYINKISTTTLYLYDTKANAEAGGATGRQDLTASSAANSERHTLTRTTDTRPDLGVTGTTSTAGTTIDACAFSDFNAAVLTSKVTLTDSIFSNCQSLTQSSATIDNCTFNTPSTALGVAFLACNDPAKITNSTFLSGSFGHAIELTSTTGSPFTFAGNTFTSYGPIAIDFHTTTDVDAGTDTVTQTSHGYSTGAAVRYMKHGGSVNMGLTDNTTYYVRAVSSSTLAFYESKYEADNDSGRIALTSTGSETHYIYSMNAAIYNNSGGAITLSVTSGGTYPLSVRNGSGSSTTVTSSVDVTVTVKNQSGTVIPGVEVAIFQDNAARTVVLSSTPTDENGEVTTSVAASLGAIIIRARQSTNQASFLTSASGIDATSEVITTTNSHNFRDGDAVVYSKNGGTAAVGLTAGNTYYVNNISSTTLSLHSTAANAISDTSRVNLSVDGSETHLLDPVRYVSASATGTVGTGNFSAQITMVTDTIAAG